MDPRGPVTSDSTWFRIDGMAIRLSEIVAVTRPENREGTRFPFEVQLKNRKVIHIQEVTGQKLLQALY